MRRIAVVAAVASLALAAESGAQGSGRTIGGGPVLRRLDPSAVTGMGEVGLSAQIGLLRGAQEARVRPQGLLGFQLYGPVSAIPDCPPNVSCPTRKNLALAANASLGISVRMLDVLPRLRWVAGAGAYWGGTDNFARREGQGARSRLSLGANGGFALSLGDRLEAELRAHAPFDLDEVRWFLAPTVSVRW